MGLGWAGFLSGLGQGMERASGSVDQYVAQKKLAQQLAMQQAQQDHMIRQDALNQKNYLERVKTDKEHDERAKRIEDKGIITQDLMNMTDDSMPMATMPTDWQASARLNVPTQIAYQPPSMGKSDPIKGEVGPSEGGEYVKRFVTPGERNNIHSMETALAKSNATNDMLYATRGANTDERYYAADRAAAAREAALRLTQERQDKERKNRAGQFGFTQANVGYDRWLKDEWGPANPLTLADIQKNPLSANKYRPPSPDQIAQKKLELFQNAIGAAGYAPSDYPDILNKMGVPMGDPSVAGGPLANQAPNQAPPPQMAPPPMMASHAPPPAMMTAHAQPGPPPPAPPAPWANKFPDPKAAPPAPKAITINELKSIAPTLKAAGVKVDTDADLLNYARNNGYTVTP